MPPPQRNIRNPHPCTRCRQHHIRCVMQDSGVCRKCARMKATCTFGEFADMSESPGTRSSTPAGGRQEYHERRGSSSSSHMKRSFDNYGSSHHSHPYRTSGSPPLGLSSEPYLARGLPGAYGSQGSLDSLDTFHDPHSASPGSRYWNARGSIASEVPAYIDSSAAASLDNLNWNHSTFSRRGSQSSDWSDDLGLWHPEMGIGTQSSMSAQMGYGYSGTPEVSLPLGSLDFNDPPMRFRTKLMPNSCVCFQSKEGQCFCQPNSHCGCLTGPYFDRYCYNTPTM